MMRNVIAILIVLFITSCAGNVDKSKTQKHTTKPKNQVADQNALKIAALIPLSGQNEKVGQNIANAITLAQDEITDNKIVVKIYDTKDNTNIAAELAIKDGAEVILGPLLSNQTSNLKINPKLANLPILSLSNNEELAGNNVFILGLHPKRQLFSVAENLMSKGVNNFFIITPNSKGNIALIAEFDEFIKKNNAAVNNIQKYNDDKTMEFASNSISQSISSENNVALIILDNASNTSTIVDKLVENRVDLSKIHIILLNQQEHPELKDNELLKGAIYASIENPKQVDFIQKYINKYKDHPERLSAIAHESVFMLHKILIDNGKVDIPTIASFHSSDTMNGEMKFENNVIVRKLNISTF